MKKILLISVVVICSLAGTAASSQIGDLRWDQSNIQTLRSFDKAAVVRFLNESGGIEGSFAALKEQYVREFEWIDLAGDGRYELVLTDSSGPCCVFLAVYSQEAPGKVRFQSFDGAGKLSETVRDLNGDGKGELIIWTELASPGTWAPTAETPRWPAVYRLENGKYVEASRDFPDYYDKEVLPQLDKTLHALQQKSTKSREYRGALGRVLLQRNKILRVLDRNPTAGLDDAYQWMDSGDSQLLQCAVATFADIGGHDKELRAAQQAIKPAFEREMAARRGG